MPQQENGLMWGFQLWVNLPAADKMTAPRYQDIAPERIARVEPAPGVQARVIAGRLGEAVGPVQGIATGPLFLDITLAAGARFELDLPEEHHAFAYVFEGESAEVGGEPLSRGELAVLSEGDRLTLGAGTSAARLLVVAGRPLNETVARYGPFVMNTPAQIQEAIADFRAGRF
jgi:redox-sensitive bicupin YhaK (pirin superfamily)